MTALVIQTSANPARIERGIGSVVANKATASIRPDFTARNTAIIRIHKANLNIATPFH